MPLLFFGSPKGGVGKTTVAANVAAALAQLRYPVTALDLDPQNALRLHFGVPLNDTAGFAWILAHPNGTPPWTAFLRQTQWGVNLLPFGDMDAHQAMTMSTALTRHPERLQHILGQLLTDPRHIVVVDSPPGPSAALSAALPYVDMLVCVLLADAISAAMIPGIEAGRAFGPGTQRGQEGGRLRYVLNQFDPGSRLSQATAAAMRAHLGPRLLGELRRDEAVAEAAATQWPLPFFAPGSAAASDIMQITQAIAGAFGLAGHRNPTP